MSANKPFNLWEMDFVDPLSTTEHGNHYIIVFVDHFSKWLEMKAVLDQSADTAAKAFFSLVISRFGLLDQIQTDRGIAF